MGLKTMRDNARIILLDIGGTFVKSALGIAGKGAVEGTFESVPISSEGTVEQIEYSFQESVRLQKAKAQKNGFAVEAICAALPGPFDYKNGIFMMKHKFAAVYGRGFREILGDEIGPEVRLSFVHDVNSVLLGALSSDPFLMEGRVALTTLGTGLGFAYAVDGEVQLSFTGSPAKGLWNLPYLEGILEDYVSRRAILRFYSEMGGVLSEGQDVKEIAGWAMTGDEKAKEAFRMVGRHYAVGARGLLRELGISRLFFAGQIAKSFFLMEDEIKKGLADDITIFVLDDIQGTVFTGLSNI